VADLFLAFLFVCLFAWLLLWPEVYRIIVLCTPGEQNVLNKTPQTQQSISNIQNYPRKILHFLQWSFSRFQPVTQDCRRCHEPLWGVHSKLSHAFQQSRESTSQERLKTSHLNKRI